MVISMAVKNRNQHESGRYRLAIKCPNCGSGCLVYTSEDVSQVSRKYYVRCQNILCNGVYTGVFEITGTIHEPRDKQPGVPQTLTKSEIDALPPVAGELF